MRKSWRRMSACMRTCSGSGDKVLSDLDKLRAAGKNRGATCQQLLAQKLTVQNLIGRFACYGIREDT